MPHPESPEPEVLFWLRPTGVKVLPEGKIELTLEIRPDELRKDAPGGRAPDGEGFGGGAKPAPPPRRPPRRRTGGPPHGPRRPPHCRLHRRRLPPGLRAAGVQPAPRGPRGALKG